MNTCGKCIHSRSMPENLNNRVCKGAPPQMVPLLQPNFSTTIKHMFPIVLATDEACGLFKPKITVDHINGEVVE